MVYDTRNVPEGVHDGGFRLYRILRAGEAAFELTLGDLARLDERLAARYRRGR